MTIQSAVQGLLDLDTKTVQEQLEITNDLQKLSEKNKQPPLPHHLEDHNYSNYVDTSFTVDQQYADDIGWASTAEHIIENIEKKNTKNSKKLKERNLLINQSKTEKYNIKKMAMIAEKKMQIRRQFTWNNRRHK